MYLIILVALVIALGGGIAVTLVLFRNKGNLIFLLNWTSEYLYHIIFDILLEPFLFVIEYIK